MSRKTECFGKRRSILLMRQAARLFAFPMVAMLSASSIALVGPTPELRSRDKDIALEIQTGTRDIKLSGTVGASVIQPAKLKMSQTSYDLRFSYGVSDNFTPYALVGLSKANVGLINLSAGGISQGGLNMNGENGLLWGVGADYHISVTSFAPDVALGVSGEYRRSTSEINRGEIQLDEFRMALKASRKYDKATFYGGLLYSKLNATFSGQTSTGVQSAGPIESDNDFGLAAGVNYAFTERISGRMEGEFLTGLLFNLSVSYKIGGPWLQRDRAVTPPPPEPALPSERRSDRRAEDRRTEPRGREARAYAPSGDEIPVAEDDVPSPTRRVKPAEPPSEAGPRRRVKPASPPPEVTSSPLQPDRETRATRDRPSEAEERQVFEEKSSEELVKIGNELTELSRYDEAITQYRRAVGMDPGNFRARYNLATAQYLNRDYASAKLSYEESIKLMPRDAEAHLFLGFCYYRMGQHDGAVRAWQRTLELDPQNAIALNNLQAMGR